MIRHYQPNMAGLPPRRSNQGLTLMEMIVAITIVLIIMVGVVWSFIGLLESHDMARARMTATQNARAAMELLSLEVKRARNTTGTLGLAFTGQTISNAGNGDRIDQDRDGKIDEESLNGSDDDSDWVLATSDRHALIPAGSDTYAERPIFYKKRDLGDDNIDIDLGETSATVEFDTYDVPGEPLDRRVRFYIGSDAGGEPNTLMRVVKGIDPVTSSTVQTSGPVCYNVVNFGLLYWNHAKAKSSSSNPWETEWPPTVGSQLTVAPSSVYMTISVYAVIPKPLEELSATEKIETVTINTMVNVEAVLADPTYVAQRTTVQPIPTTP